MPAERKPIRITEQNVGLYEAFRHELQAHLEALVEMTLRYPVQVQFEGLSFLFVSRDDILRVIDLLDGQITAVRAGISTHASA